MNVRTLTFTSLLFVALTAVPAKAEPFNSESRFGLGLELGAPTGLSAKYFFGGSMAVQCGLGVMRDNWYYRYSNGLHLHAELVWHPVVLTSNSTFSLPLHVGVGGRVLDLEGRCWDGNNS